MTIEGRRSADEPGGGAVALVTGVSRRVGIGHAVARRLDRRGFRVAAAGWPAYDRARPWGGEEGELDLAGPLREVDLEDPGAAAGLVPAVARDLGPVSVLVLCHCESVDADIASTTVESFDRHMAVNGRATWQLIKAYAQQFDGRGPGRGEIRRIVSITSDHTAGNLPYGASKAAMDRIVLAAAVELADIGVTANVINPGATDTGWLTPDIERRVLARNLQARLGRPDDVANLVEFLCSAQGQWVNGQLLHSDGGLR